MCVCVCVRMSEWELCVCVCVRMSEWELCMCVCVYACSYVGSHAFMHMQQVWNEKQSFHRSAFIKKHLHAFVLFSDPLHIKISLLRLTPTILYIHALKQLHMYVGSFSFLSLSLSFMISTLLLRCSGLLYCELCLHDPHVR